MGSSINSYSKYTVFISFSFVVGLAAWVFSNFLKAPLLFNIVYTLFFLILGILNLFFVFSCKKTSSNWFYGVLLFGISMFCWAIGEFIWFFYANILALPSFYPSIADIFYSMIYPLMFFALIYFSLNLSEVSVEFLNKYKKLTLVSLLLILVGYLFVLYGKQNLFFSTQENLQSFFDVTYLLWDALLIIGNIFVFGYLLLFHATSPDLISTIVISSSGMVLLFIADVIFSYSMGVGLYIEGNYIDLIYMFSGYLISLGIISFLYKLHIPK